MNILRNRKQCRDDSRRGAVLVMVALMSVVLLGVVAFVADLGIIIVTKTTLSSAADAAALAAAGAMSAGDSLDDVRAVAAEYAALNVPESYGEVADTSSCTFGVWDPENRTFTPNNMEPNAVKVVTERTQSRNNAVPYFFGGVFNKQMTDVTAEAIAVAATHTADAVYYNSVYVTSTKDLSNVVLEFADGTHQKFEGLQGYTQTFQGTGEHAGKEIIGVWIKSGCNGSGDGPGYGERITFQGDSTTVHGENAHQGCTPHVSATFHATGPQFTNSGAPSPVRLVK